MEVFSSNMERQEKMFSNRNNEKIIKHGKKDDVILDSGRKK
jgi:hypothetical protein